jgi:chemotaxis signal transduction protein
VEANNQVFGLLVNTVSEVLAIEAKDIQPVSETLSKKIGGEYLKGVIVDKSGSGQLILYLNADTIFIGKK